MEKKLPNVFVNSKARSISSNNNTLFYSKIINKDSELVDLNGKKIKELTIRKKVNEIFSSSRFVYKVKVLITTSEAGTTKETLISKNSDYILTISNKKIKYEEIQDIKLI